MLPYLQGVFIITCFLTKSKTFFISSSDFLKKSENQKKNKEAELLLCEFYIRPIGISEND